VLDKPNSDYKCGKQDSSSVLQMFIGLLKPQKNIIITTIVCSLILSVLGITSSFFSKIIIDEIIPYNLKDSLVFYSVVFLIINLF